jgi:hypothetical protein
MDMKLRRDTKSQFGKKHPIIAVTAGAEKKKRKNALR